ncbi:MAG: hypothetical protein MUF87_14895 [Anaerolineae bacterium]|jgi:hypothetical protein|nr:hypothetical protein [Anaerolineae bacterium]
MGFDFKNFEPNAQISAKSNIEQFGVLLIAKARELCLKNHAGRPVQVAQVEEANQHLLHPQPNVRLKIFRDLLLTFGGLFLSPLVQTILTQPIDPTTIVGQIIIGFLGLTAIFAGFLLEAQSQSR